MKNCETKRKIEALVKAKSNKERNELILVTLGLYFLATIGGVLYLISK